MQISISVTQTATELNVDDIHNIQSNYLMVQSTIAWALLQNKFELEHAIFFLLIQTENPQDFSVEKMRAEFHEKNIFMFSSHEPE